ncbi:MAG: hypothetical protein JO235_00065 [Chroococcidiopsidaceae cyanobacterium CP_BM_RX_35]|nr:hypothetical protein [Chroococcidiopsidaceae cyanobacterium CP_BM_RX_35]
MIHVRYQDSVLGHQQKRVNVDFSLGMTKALDYEAKRLDMTRQFIIQFVERSGSTKKLIWEHTKFVCSL